MPAIKNKSQKTRFILVGVCNTAIDFSLLFGLKFLGLPAIGANIISTSAAFTFSFFANRKYTFKTTGGDVKKQLFLFIIVTLAGLWGVQTIVITIVTALLHTTFEPGVTLLIAKLLATVASLIWNYVFYSRVIFKSSVDNRRKPE